MTLTAHTDGASRGNPGPSGCGYTIEKEGIILEKHAQYIGSATNNQAEYIAFILALKRLKEIGATDVIIYSDSELLIRHIHGVYKVRKEKLKPLYTELMNIVSEFKSFKAEHISREYNSFADNLAKNVIKTQHSY